MKQSNFDKAGTVGTVMGAITVIALLMAVVYGYVSNIMWLVCSDITWTFEQTISVLGIFMAPLGILLGWMH